MPQLTIYLDEKTLKRIETASHSEQSSISRWVKKRLSQSLRTNWPEGYFDLFGSLRGSDLRRPSQLSFRNDSKRAVL